MGEREVMRLLLALTFLVAVALAQQSSTPPFYRTLEFHQPMFSGNDVYILQSLLNRDPAVTPNITVDGYFGRDTQTAVKQFQGAHSLTADGTAGEATCNALLQYHLADKYTDDLRFPSPCWLQIQSLRSSVLQPFHRDKRNFVRQQRKSLVGFQDPHSRTKRWQRQCSQPIVGIWKHTNRIEFFRLEHS